MWLELNVTEKTLRKLHGVDEALKEAGERIK